MPLVAVPLSLSVLDQNLGLMYLIDAVVVLYGASQDSMIIQMQWSIGGCDPSNKMQVILA